MNNGPHECNICYECHASLVLLSCLHSLCQTCLSRLQKRACPFCRRDFLVPERVTRVIPELKSESAGEDNRIPVIRIRVRRRRRRIRTTTDTLDTVYGTVIIETPHDELRRKKPKAGKNNFRKGNWTRSNHRNGSMRVK